MSEELHFESRPAAAAKAGFERRPVPPRIAIEAVRPEIDCGRFPIKRTIGEEVEVEADVHADGHDLIFAILRFRAAEADEWNETIMEPAGNDRWRARFTVTRLGMWEYQVDAWVDTVGTWVRDLEKRANAGQDLTPEFPIGAALIEEAAARAPDADAKRLRLWAAELLDEKRPAKRRVSASLDPERLRAAGRSADRRRAVSNERVLSVSVDRERARAGAWYEMFPRSTAGTIHRHGTFCELEKRLSYVAGMGFDVLYLPPIHPIGRTNRKGKNGALEAGPGDPGSPWAIGAAEGGHTAVHPELGTLEDFRSLREHAGEVGLEIALDLAYQCSPDHPWVKEHPNWFRRRPDGAIRYAENPPKKYEDIYPLDFECDDWRALWEALREIVRFWIGEGVKIFRADNPHTKPYAFWEWLIGTIRREHPETIFLSEAFTRPKIMRRLAKLGFQQSYTYFAWRSTSAEIRDYFTELTQTDLREYFRPSLWTNTPDILTEPLQIGGRPAFVVRLLLAATLGASYGIYGPAFELCENTPLEAGKEEYLDSEKYEIRHWDLDQPATLRPLITRLNRVRRENPALQSDRGLRFLETSNDRLLAFMKTSPPTPAPEGAAAGDTVEDREAVLVVVNLDPHHAHGGWVELPLDELELDAARPYQMHDLLGDGRYLWSGPRNFVRLDPASVPAHVFKVRRRLRTERDFDYYL